MAARTAPLRQAPPAWSPTPLEVLGWSEIPNDLHFVRDHFPVPAVDPFNWSLTIEGADGPLRLTLSDVVSRRPQRLRVVLQCAGHRRTEFDPAPSGLPWSAGAVGEAEWTGTPLGELLRDVPIPDGTEYVVLEGADAGQVPGQPGRQPFARALPLAKALDGDVLLAWLMNGQPITRDRGGPVRAIVPGWYATDSIKWLTRVYFRDRPFEGSFEADDYRFRAPGEAGPGSRLTGLPVNSLITTPVPGARVPARVTTVRGIAWGGQGRIERVDVKLDDGPWLQATLEPVDGRYARTSVDGRYARTFWELALPLSPGSHRIVSRASDGARRQQPLTPAANDGGYANNAVHEVTLIATGARQIRPVTDQLDARAR